MTLDPAAFYRDFRYRSSGPQLPPLNEVHFADQRLSPELAPPGECASMDERLEYIQIIADYVSGQQIRIRLGIPGHGSLLDRQTGIITLDPEHVKGELVKAAFIAGHESSHAAISKAPVELGLDKETIRELYSKIGFAFAQNVIEDGAGNDWMTGTFPGMQEPAAEIYGKMFDNEEACFFSPEVIEFQNKLGRQPLFARFGTEILRDWHLSRLEIGVHGNLAKEAGEARLSPRVSDEMRDALLRVIGPARLAISSIPAFKSRSQPEILESARTRFSITARDIFPLFEKFVEEDLEIEQLRQAFNRFEQKKGDLQRQNQQLEKAKQEGNSEAAAEAEKQIAELERELAAFNGLTEEQQEQLGDAARRGVQMQIREMARHIERKVQQIACSRAKQQELEESRQKPGEGQDGEAASAAEQLQREIDREQSLRNEIRECVEKALSGNAQKDEIIDRMMQGIEEALSGAPGEKSGKGPPGSEGQEEGESEGDGEGPADNESRSPGQEGQGAGEGAGAQGMGAPETSASGSSRGECVADSSGSDGAQPRDGNSAGGQEQGSPQCVSSESSESCSSGEQQASSADSQDAKPESGPPLQQPIDPVIAPPVQETNTNAGSGESGERFPPYISMELEQEVQRELEEKHSREGNLPLDTSQLGQEALDSIRQSMFEGMDDETVNEIFEQAEFEMKKLEDLVNEDLVSKMKANRAPTHKELDREESIKAEKSDRSEPVETVRSEPVRQEDWDRVKKASAASLEPYEQVLENEDDLIARAKRDVKKAIIATEKPRRLPNHRTGRLNAMRAMQAEMDLNKEFTEWDRKITPKRKSVSFAVIADRSRSMEGQKAYFTFTGMVVVSEALEAQKIPHAEWIFDNNVERVKDFDESSRSDDVRRRMANVLRVRGNTDDAHAIRWAYKELKERKEDYKFIFMFSDAQTGDPDGLVEVMSRIKKEGQVVLIHFGLGPLTEDRRHIYPYSFGNLLLGEPAAGEPEHMYFNRLMPRVLAHIMREPERYFSYQAIDLQDIFSDKDE